MGVKACWIRAQPLREALDGLPAIIGARSTADVRRSLGGSTIARIESASDWAPLDLDLALIGAIDDVLDRHGLRAWSHDHALQLSRRAPYGALVHNAIRLFGLSVDSLCRVAARSWMHVYRGMGRLRHEREAHDSVALRWSDVPAWVHEHDAFRDSVAAGFEAVLTLTRHQGIARIDPVGAGELRITVQSERARRAV